MGNYKDMGYGDLVALHGQLSKEFEFAGPDRKVVLSGQISELAAVMSEKLPDELNVAHNGSVVPANADAVSDVADVAAQVRSGGDGTPNPKDEVGEPKGKQMGSAK